MIDPHDIAQRLSTYLGAPIARMSVLASGWETTVFEFTLEAVSKRFPSIPVGIPMVLRFYQGSAADAKGNRERITIERLFAEPRAAYLHAHFAAPGCYAARIERA